MKIFKNILCRFFTVALCVGLLGLTACEPDLLQAPVTNVTPTTGEPEPGDTGVDGGDTEGDDTTGGGTNGGDDGGTEPPTACTSTDPTDTDADAVVNDCDDDDDADGVADVGDNCSLISNTDQTNNDTDASGDVCDTDDDGDGFSDDQDNCELIANSDQKNTDGDENGDACDDDDDGDGDLDSADNCVLVANTDQVNTDADANGDACDDDDDGDGVLDDSDAFPLDATESVDSDGDSFGDNSDVCPSLSDDQLDTDTDGVGDACDNCELVANADQADFEGDGLGDACDQDDDGDGDLAQRFGGTDCNDKDARQSGIHVEIFDFIDNNCDPSDGADIGVSLGDSTVRIEGEAAGDELGYSVSIVGDVNGDGFGDVLISAPYNDDAGNDAGQVYLFFGSSTLQGELSVDAADVFFKGKAANDYLGWSAAGAGDVNGDGMGDILLGAKNNDAGGTNSGRVYLVNGRNFTSGTDFDLDSANAIFTGEAASDSLGSAVAGVGDVNLDGQADILLAATGASGYAGKIYFFQGGSLTGAVFLSSAQAIFSGEDAGDTAGTALAPAGDMNGDFYADFVIGAPGNDENGSSAGKAYFVYGGSLNGNYDLADADLSYIGEGSNHYAGKSVDGGVDVNGDGLGDVLIGAYNYDAGVGNEGRAYLVYGTDSGATGDYDLNTADVIFTGEAGSDYAGRAVVLVDDMNGDGFGEVLIGSYLHDDVGDSNAGKIYFVSGRDDADFDPEIILGDSTADATLLGENAGDYAGFSVSAGGDVNGDSITDIVIGAYGFDGDGGSNLDSGKVYFLTGE